MKTKLFVLTLIAACLSGAPHALAQGSAFTYQGRLSDNGGPANGSYDLNFVLYDAANGGAALGTNTIPGTAVVNGLYTTTLDFGTVFDGNSHWLEVAVRTNGSGAFTAMNPRQQITPTPQALYATTAASANSVAAANIVGIVPLAHLPTELVTNNQSGVTLRGAFTGDGGGLTNLPAASLTGTLADSQLSTNIARLNVPNTATPATGGVVTFSGFLVGVGVTNGGSGYTAAPLVTVTDVSGSNAVITATVSNGVVVSLAIQNAGINYSAGTTLAIAPPPSNAYQTFSSGIVFNGVNTFNNVSNTFAGAFTGNGGNLTNLNAATLVGTAGNFSASTITISSNLYLPTTTSTAGIIYCGGISLIHSFGNRNIFVGVGAGNLTMTNGGNTAVGCQSLTSNTTGYLNTANGDHALNANTTGINNTANGALALASNTTGDENTATGKQALTSNTTGSLNTAIGTYALNYNTTGSANTAVGDAALIRNTTGGNNVGNGYWALYFNTTGSRNTANGYKALVSNTTGNNNTADGYQALNSNTTGSNNIALGYQAGYNITTGRSNIAIGNMGLATDNNIIRIGSSQTQAFIAGNVLIGGTTNAVERLEVAGTDTAYSPGCSIRIRNILDPIGGFIGNGWNALQFGMYNPSASSVGVISASAKRSFFGFDLNGKVGSLANDFGSPNYRNLLDDGAGNMRVAGVINGNGGGLTNLSANAVTGGLTINLAVLVPGGGTNTLCFTNGILRAIQ
jgi:hypothetical protein